MNSTYLETIFCIAELYSFGDTELVIFDDLLSLSKSGFSQDVQGLDWIKHCYTFVYSLIIIYW